MQQALEGISSEPTVYSKRSVNALTLLFPQPPRMAAGSLHHLGRGCGDQEGCSPEEDRGGHPSRLGFVASSEKRGEAHPSWAAETGAPSLLPKISQLHRVKRVGESETRRPTSSPAPRAWLKAWALCTHAHPAGTPKPEHPFLPLGTSNRATSPTLSSLAFYPPLSGLLFSQQR